MKKAYIYVRVSTDEQAEEGKSIETQERLCRKWAKDNDHVVLEVFRDEGKSATTLNRPALQNLIAKCQKDAVDAILVQDTDRLARNTLDHLTLKSVLKKKNVDVVSVSQPMLDDSPEGSLMDTMIASFNAFQSQITGRKTSKVLQQKAELGWFPGGIPQLGYKNVENPNPTSTLDRQIIGLDNYVVPHVKTTFEMYATGNHSINALVEYLRSKNIKSPRGYDIHPSLVANMLKNIFYIGKFRWNGKVYEGKHPTFIDKDLFERVQDVLRIHNQGASRKRKHNFLLRGFIYCADCKNRMWADVHTKRSGLVFKLYFCPKCRKYTYVEHEKLEKRVEKLFTKIEISDSYVEMVLAKAQTILEETRTTQDTQKRRILAEQSKIEKAIRETEDSRFIHHTLTDEAFQRISARYEIQLGIIKDELSKLAKDHSKAVKVLEKVLRLAENIGGAYMAADYPTKRDYLGIFFKNFKIRNGKIVSFALTDDLKPLIENGSVRVSDTGLPREDSNLQPHS